eukprot:gb/GECH01003280.1/.p1 GENE.gb/GECH01003280.1/~~gb/GECH01003280.1/.p1  ORF type:complete len:281 (+),score=75.73 gb/GECH01003280.1/:1-843(+)
MKLSWLLFVVCIVGIAISHSAIASSSESDASSSVHLAHHDETDSIINMLEELENKLRNSIQEEKQAIQNTTEHYDQQIENQKDLIDNLNTEISAAEDELTTIKANKATHKETARESNQLIQSHKAQLNLIEKIRGLLLGGRSVCESNAQCDGDEVCYKSVCHETVNAQVLSQGTTSEPVQGQDVILSQNECDLGNLCEYLSSVDFSSEFVVFVNSEEPAATEGVTVNNIVKMTDYHIEVDASPVASSGSGSQISAYPYALLALPRVSENMNSVAVKLIYQ